MLDAIYNASTALLCAALVVRAVLQAKQGVRLLTHNQAEQLRNQCWAQFGKSATANVVQKGFQNYVVRVRRTMGDDGYRDVRSMAEATAFMGVTR